MSIPMRSFRTLRRAVATTGSTALLVGAGVLGLTVPQAWAATATGGSGASLAYAEVQAENSSTNGSVIGPSYTQGQLADEASYRKAVTLQGTGKYIEDSGMGIANTENLFVPFYTTKPKGSGVGLALAQQIARAHGGEIRLVNREDAPGARAIIHLPLA